MRCNNKKKLAGALMLAGSVLLGSGGAAHAGVPKPSKDGIRCVVLRARLDSALRELSTDMIGGDPSEIAEDWASITSLTDELELSGCGRVVFG